MTYNAHDMSDAIYRALDLFSDKEAWSALVQNAFAYDSAWKRSAEEYLQVYNDTL
jgi:starch synthase